MCLVTDGKPLVDAEEAVLKFLVRGSKKQKLETFFSDIVGTVLTLFVSSWSIKSFAALSAAISPTPCTIEKDGSLIANQA